MLSAHLESDSVNVCCLNVTTRTFTHQIIDKALYIMRVVYTNAKLEADLMLRR